MPNPFRSFRPALRALARSRSFTVTAVLTLALGVGAATAIFTLLERVVLDPLPYPQPERLVRLKNPVPGVGANTAWELSTAQYFYFADSSHTLDKVALFNQGLGILDGDQGRPAQRVQLAVVTASIFPLIGARAAVGRVIAHDDDVPGAPAVAMLSNGFWRRQFGADPGVVGRTIPLNGQPVQVVGVMAPGIALPGEPGQAVRLSTDIWVPADYNPAGPFYNNHTHPAIAQLAPGVTAAQAQAELARMTRVLPELYPNAYSQAFLTQYKFHTTVQPLKTYVVGHTAGYLWILFAAVGLVLAIACVNVVNLLLVRLEARRREFAVRSALGAGWRHLAADAFREGAVVALVAAVLGVGIAWVGIRWLVTLAPAGVPRLEDVRMDAGVLVFAAGLGLAVAALLALVPAWHARAERTMNLLGDGGRTSTTGVARRRLRSGLVVAQVALALVLVVSAGLLLRSFARLRAVDPGVDPRGVLTVGVYLPNNRYDSATRQWQFYSQLLTAVRALPGVTSAGLSEEVPFQGGYGCTVQGFEDQAVVARVKDAGQTTCAGQEPTSPGYFEAMGIPVLKGRDFTPADNDQPDLGAVVVSKAFADFFWPGQDPIGKGVAPNGTGKPFYHVVGVVGDVHSQTVNDPPARAIYYPVAPNNPKWAWAGGLTLVVRAATGNPSALLPQLRRVVSSIDPSVPLADAQDMSTIVSRSMSQLSFTMTLLGIAGVTALLLAAIGLYGVISYIVARRTNEIGVRLALGAQPSQVRGTVVREALTLALLGLGIGVPVALVSARVLGSLLYGVASWDPAAYLASAIVMLAIALLAAYFPARRAAGVDPAIALRAE
jgi:predicted permease